jgi:Peptidase C39 family
MRQLSQGAHICRCAAALSVAPRLGGGLRGRSPYLIAVFAILWISAAGLPTQGATQSEEERRSLRCGPNAVLALLVLSGHPQITESQLDAVPISCEGASLLDLRNLARKLRVYTEIRHYRIADIDSVPLPMIAQFENAPGAAVSDHFCVIYKVDKRYYYQIDGTTGLRQAIKRSHLGYWTGFAMSAPGRRGVDAAWCAELLAGAGLDAVILTLWRRWLEHTSRRSTLQEANV